MSEPMTQAGKRLVEESAALWVELEAPVSTETLTVRILAIEAEARADVVEELRKAVRAIPHYAYDSLVPNTGPALIEPHAVLVAIDRITKGEG